MSPTYVPGLYQAEILDHGFESSRVKGTPGFVLRLRILGRLDAQDALHDCPRYERRYTQFLANDTGARILLGDLRALGIELASLLQLDRRTKDHIDLVGRKIRMRCDHENYQGELREKWSIDRPREKVDVDTLRRLSEQFDHLLAGDNVPEKQAPPTTTPTKDK
jgi:hypothetical protein